jgi:membrane protein implicated in regulation of membrane protease activity
MADLFEVSLPMLLFVIGVGLTAAEAFIPGAHFLVVGVALLVAGLVGILFPPLGGPLALAAVTLVVGAASLYLYRELGIYQGTGAATTSDSDSLRGTVGTVTERVTTTSGEVKLDDGGFNPYYRARTMSGTIDEDERVMFIDPGGGNVVTVESLGAVEDDIDRELARERDRSREREAEDS